METQEIADRAESAAIARLIAMREVFQPCWGRTTARQSAVTRSRPRRKRIERPAWWDLVDGRG